MRIMDFVVLIVGFLTLAVSFGHSLLLPNKGSYLQGINSSQQTFDEINAQDICKTTNANSSLRWKFNDSMLIAERKVFQDMIAKW